MSKKKLTARSAMPLKDFHGGQIVSDLSLPSAPGGSKERPLSYSSGLGGYGMGMGPSGHGTPPSSAISSALIGRHFSEDERKSSSSPWGADHAKDDPLPGQRGPLNGSISATRTGERPRVVSYSGHLPHLTDPDRTHSAVPGMAAPVVGSEWKMYGTDVNVDTFKSNLVSKPQEPEPERSSHGHSAADFVRGHQGLVAPEYSALARGDRDVGSHTVRSQEAVAPVSKWQKHSEERVDGVPETRPTDATTRAQEQQYRGRQTSAAPPSTQGSVLETREEGQAHGRDRRTSGVSGKVVEAERNSGSLALAYGYGMGAADWNRPKSSALLKAVEPSASSLTSRQPYGAKEERHIPEEALVAAKPFKVDMTAEADKYVDPRDSSVEEEARQSEEEEQPFVLGWEERFTGEEDIGERPEVKQTNVGSTSVSPASLPAAGTAEDVQPTSSLSSRGEWVADKVRGIRQVAQQGGREADTWRKPVNPPSAPPALVINSALVKPSSVNSPKKSTGLGIPSALELAEAFSRTNFSRPASDAYKRGSSNPASAGNGRGSGSFRSPGYFVEEGSVGRAKSGSHGDGTVRREGSATRGGW